MPPKKRKLEEAEEQEFKHVTEEINKQRIKRHNAETVLQEIDRDLRDKERVGRDIIIKKALTEQLRKCWNDRRCILCKKETNDQNFFLQPKCGCEWHDHGLYRSDSKSRSFRWISVVSQNDCVACVYSNLMPRGGGLGDRLHFQE